MVSHIDYRAAFKSMPGAVALLSPDLVILDANDGYLDAAGRDLDEIVGREILEAFPENPSDPRDAGPRDLRASLTAVLSTGMPDFIDQTRYDVEVPGHPGEFEERYWMIANVPVRDADGQIGMIVHVAHEVTYLMRTAEASNA